MTEEANATPTDPVEDKEEVADEQDIDDFDDVQPPPEDEVPDTKPFDEEAAHEEEVVDDTPDFSIYVTNVAERLWRANKAAEQIKITTSPDLIKRTAEYQEWRKKMDLLNKYVDDYSAAMKALSEKRNTVRDASQKNYRECSRMFENARGAFNYQKLWYVPDTPNSGFLLLHYSYSNTLH